ncbi:MAG: phosphonate C-P lyase system protein PhnL [Candidatus Puniceispirillales bacterium]|jgi:alpha-D-ribose 1-methylphosphonate 5-triphosphate synthase subunit PhnL|tara:strand:- start:572 stop:1237 length:666 start_codon:yes stop_codon:yes gene_type:complete
MIQIKNLNKSFELYNQNNTNINVFKNINFKVNKGEVVALTGNSGTGKSTLLKLIYGSYIISKGDVLISDINIRKSTPRDILKLRKNRLGYVSQFLRVVPRVPTIEVVIEPLLDIGCEKNIALKKGQEILERLKIPKNLWNLSPLTFSGGEQQRVNIARGFIYNYPYLLLDEPTASLDQNNKNIVLDLIEKAKLNGSAIIGIFHDEIARNRVASREVNLENL